MTKSWYHQSSWAEASRRCLAVELFLIAAVGLWQQAMISIYLVSVSAAIACLIGIPIGIACAWSDRLNAVVTVVIDTLQTFLTFVYLIPVIMLFGVGEFSAIVAVVLYAVRNGRWLHRAWQPDDPQGPERGAGHDGLRALADHHPHTNASGTAGDPAGIN